MLSIQNYWIIVVVIILVCVIIPSRSKFMMNQVKKKRKGRKIKMPKEMLQELIGKDCIITIFNDFGSIQGKLITVEENWIKVEEKKKVRIINGDMIKDISVLK